MIRSSDRSSRFRPGGSRPAQQQAFSLVEAVVSIVIVAGMFAAALTTVAASRRTEQTIESRSRAELLAHGLMSEILCKCYEEPDDSPQFGRESGEGFSSRAQWDDVDDYERWSSCPPRDRDGSILAGLEEYSRSVEVVFVNPKDSSLVTSTDSGVKRITVTVRRKDLKLAEMVALRTEAWPVDEETALEILFIVTNSASPTDEEQARRVLMESWGFRVTLIDAGSSYLSSEADRSKHDVVYISEEVGAAGPLGELRIAPIGIVNESLGLAPPFGFCESGYFKTRDQIKIVDNTHYITQGFDLGYTTVFTSPQPIYLLQHDYAPDLRVLSEYYNVGSEGNNKPSLVVLDTGAGLYGGGTAPERRVQLPWGDSAFTIGSLNANAQTIMKRAIEWAAQKEETP